MTIRDLTHHLRMTPLRFGARRTSHSSSPKCFGVPGRRGPRAPFPGTTDTFVVMRLRNLLAVVALGAPAIAGADKPDKKREDLRSFRMSGYSYCDVKVLSALW